jgi:hypothetical protein
VCVRVCFSLVVFVFTYGWAGMGGWGGGKGEEGMVMVNTPNVKTTDHHNQLTLR